MTKQTKQNKTKEEELFEMEQELGIPENLRYHNRNIWICPHGVKHDTTSKGIGLICVICLRKSMGN